MYQIENDLKSLHVNEQHSKEFLKLLIEGNNGLIDIREIDTDETTKRRLFLQNREQIEKYHPSVDANVLVGIFTRKNFSGKKYSCLATMMLWADYDGFTKEQVERKISSVGLPEPSVWVNSGHGIHTYWLLEKPSSEGVSAVLKAIAKQTGGDSGVTDIARVMRLPGTMNVKADPVPCRIIKINNTRFSLQDIAEIIGVDLDAAIDLDKPQIKVEIPVLAESSMACLRLMSGGVTKGKRNFALGKIVALLKLHGYSKSGALDLVLKWNENNNPPKSYIELRNEFERFWAGDYQYLGCSFSNPRLQAINESLCSMGECEHHIQQEIQVLNQDELTVIDNEIFKDTVFPEVKGLELAIYTIVSQEKEIKRDHLLELLKRNKTDKAFPQSLNRLKSLGYIEVVKNGIRNEMVIRLKAKDNYGRGYTIINSLLWKIYICKEISDTEYKLLSLLKWFAYGKKIVFPTITLLARKMGVTERTISKVLADLERKLYLKRNYKPLQNGGTKMFIQLKF